VETPRSNALLAGLALAGGLALAVGIVLAGTATPGTDTHPSQLADGAREAAAGAERDPADEVELPRPGGAGTGSDATLPDQAADRSGAAPGPGGSGHELICQPNGCDIWKRELLPAATILPVGDLLLTTDGSRVSAHDAGRGEAVWSSRLGAFFDGPVPVDLKLAEASGSLLLLGQGQLTRVDPTNGRPRWQVDLGTRWVTRVARIDDAFVVTTSDRLRGRSRPLPTTVIALGAEDGEIRWERRVLDVLTSAEPPPVSPAASDPAGSGPADPTTSGPAAMLAGGPAGQPHGSGPSATEGVVAVALDRTTIGGIDAITGETVWERSAVGGYTVGDHVVLRGGNGRALLLDGATGVSSIDLGDDVAGLDPVGSLLVATSGEGRSFVVDPEGEVTDRRTGPPLGSAATSTDAFIAWEDDGWVLIVRYDRSGEPAGSRRLPGRIGSWGGALVLGAHAGSDLVRVIGVDGRTTVAVRTDGPTEPPPNPSVAPSGARLHLIGRTIVSRDDGGLSVQAPGGAVRVRGGREVIAVTSDGTVVVRGDRGLLGIDPDRLGPVTTPDVPGRP
jgi:outer membrane protein assembly factor BamB